MSDNNKAYQAIVMSELTKGNQLPSIEDIIRDKLQKNKEVTYKREEIVDYVAMTIGFPKDESISGVVSGILKKFEENGTAVRVGEKQGYWQGK